MTADLETQPLLISRNDTAAQDPCHLDKANKQTEPDEVTWRIESRLIARHSIPLVATYLLQYFYTLVIVLVCSRLSTEELAAASLGITTTNIVGYAIFEGMATALDTLCAQAYGAGNVQMVGHLSRSASYWCTLALLSADHALSGTFRRAGTECWNLYEMVADRGAWLCFLRSRQKVHASTR